MPALFSGRGQKHRQRIEDDQVHAALLLHGEKVGIRLSKLVECSATILTLQTPVQNSLAEDKRRIVSPRRVRYWSSGTSQILTVPSSPAEVRRLPDGA